MNKIIKIVFGIFMVGVLVLSLIGCNDVMYTNRSRPLLIPEGQLATSGAESYAGIKTQSKLITNNAQYFMISRVGTRVAEAAVATMKEANQTDLISSFSWENILIDSPNVVNAFCLPGGKIAVYTGIMKIISSDDELAVVMSHEVAHAVAQHGNERVSQQLLLSLGNEVLNKVMENNSPEVKNAYNIIYGVGTTYGIMLPYSRLHESEADKVGLILMAKAGYKPQAAIAFWTKMSQQNTSKPLEFLSTHPADETRIKDLQAVMPEALKYYSGK